MKLDHPPAHIVNRGGDRHALCGVKDPMPVVGLAHVDAHVRGHAMPVCPECAARAGIIPAEVVAPAVEPVPGSVLKREAAPRRDEGPHAPHRLN